MLGSCWRAVRAARPSLTLFTRAIVEAILLVEGPIGPADSVARLLGLGDRFKLARLLRREGLPPLHRLAEWATVLAWVTRAERDGASLCWIAFRSRRHPSACYRLVREVTGRSWSEVRARGALWLQHEFLKELRRAQPSAGYGKLSTSTQAPPCHTSIRVTGWISHSVLR